VGTDMRTIALSGYYGFANSGDEAVLQSILIALREEGERLGIAVRPVVLSAQPEQTAEAYGVEAVNRMKMGEVIATLRRCDGLISGGGSLLQDATGLGSIPYYLGILKLAQWLRKPTFIYSQGIGPVQRSFFHPWIRSVFRRSRYISVRDEESAALLARMGLPPEQVHVVPDPVMGLPPGNRGIAAAERGHPVVGAAVRFWQADRSELRGLAAALREIQARTGAEIRFLPFHLPADAEASRYVMEQMGADGGRITVVDGITHPQDMLAQVGSCRLLIGMRLHSLIYAASQYVPMIGISYDPKIDHFLNRLQMKPAATAEHFEIDGVVREAIRLLEEGGNWAADKRRVIDGLKQQAHEPARRILQDLCHNQR